MNARAALITRGLAEDDRDSGVALGARADTFMGLTGLGDLILTATGELSRNRRSVLRWVAGRSLAGGRRSLGHVAEGVRSGRSGSRPRPRDIRVQMPISEAVFAVLSGRADRAAGARSACWRATQDPKACCSDTEIRLSVFCGSQQGARAEYLDSARELARVCVARGLTGCLRRRTRRHDGRAGRRDAGEQWTNSSASFPAT